MADDAPTPPAMPRGALPPTIDDLSQAITRCRICRDCPDGGPERRMPHEPRPVAYLSATARVLIAGQAPGLRVHETGLPFNDASGDRLRQWLGVDRETFYDRARFAIAPMGFCFPAMIRKATTCHRAVNVRRIGGRLSWMPCRRWS